MKHFILFIDDYEPLRQSMADFLAREGFVVKCAATGTEGIALVRQKICDFSLALVDYHLPDMTGAQVTARLRELDPDLTILGFSDDKTDPVHIEALESGAFSFLNKDAGDMKLLAVVHRHCREFERRKKPLTLQNRHVNQKVIERLGIFGCSNHLAEVARLTFRFAITDSTVFIRGENGTGKEMIASAIHHNSSRKARPFIGINCAAIPKDLIASELFGHVKGAFTGATADKVGKFKAAGHGTIFLDEIGDLSLDAQASLLRVLQEKRVTPVGSNDEYVVDARVVAATNAPLEDMIAKKLFREDLYHRLNVLPIPLKALRARPEDIPYLVHRFLEQLNQDAAAKGARSKKEILESDVEKLKAMPWPGNVRELKNTMELLFVLSEGPTLDLSKLVDNASDDTNVDAKIPNRVRKLKKLGKVVEHREMSVIKKVLEGGDSISEAARELGISRGALRNKIKKYGIKIQRTTERLTDEELKT